jgi:hypothetical protein
MKFDGMSHMFDDQVKRIIEHRKANPVKYPPDDVRMLSFEVVALELETFTCQRLGNNPKYCGDGMSLVNINRPPIIPETRTCPCGGTEFKTKFCPTCSGQRIIGFVCTKCGKEYAR